MYMSDLEHESWSHPGLPSRHFLRHWGCKSELLGCSDGVVNEGSDVGLKNIISCKTVLWIVFHLSIFDHMLCLFLMYTWETSKRVFLINPSWDKYLLLGFICKLMQPVMYILALTLHQSVCQACMSSLIKSWRPMTCMEFWLATCVLFPVLEKKLAQVVFTMCVWFAFSIHYSLLLQPHRAEACFKLKHLI